MQKPRKDKGAIYYSLEQTSKPFCTSRRQEENGIVDLFAEIAVLHRDKITYKLLSHPLSSDK